MEIFDAMVAQIRRDYPDQTADMTEEEVREFARWFLAVLEIERTD